MILICQHLPCLPHHSPPLRTPTPDLKGKGSFKTMSCICDIALGMGDRKMTGYQRNCLAQSWHFANAA